MSNPRTPRYFPHMRVRGARRRRFAPFQRLAGSFDQLAGAFDQLGRASATATATGRHASASLVRWVR